MGKLNLLHHKSWHVWKRDNLERVRKDEEKAEKGEELKQERNFEIEQERKLERLREQRYKLLETNRGDTSKLIHIDSIKSVSTTNKAEKVPLHDKAQLERFNLFTDVESTSKATNPEYESEKKKETEKREKPFTMTFESCAQRGPSAPWYAKKLGNSPTTEDAPNALKKKLVDITRKEKNDPMHSILKSKTKKVSNQSGVIKASTQKTIEQLRKERLNREQDERKRVQDALNANKPANKHQTESSHYNSQFNPDFVRKATYKPY